MHTSNEKRSVFRVYLFFLLQILTPLLTLLVVLFMTQRRRTCDTLTYIFMIFQVRFNTKTRSVEMKTSSHTNDIGGLQKGADFVSAFMMGFEVQDAVALLRLDDLYVESFQVTDVKLLKGDHLSRAIGRVAGQDGKTRFAIENATRTRIVVADKRIYMLGSYANLRVARNAICDLILGAPPGKVYNNMRNVARRMNERY